jgi:hypothetical protein
VAATQGELALELDAGPDYDADERARLSYRLRAELADTRLTSTKQSQLMAHWVERHADPE